MRSVRQPRAIAGLATLALVAAAAAMTLAGPAAASAPAPLPPPTGPVVTYESETTTTELTTPNNKSYKEITAYCRGGAELIGVGYSTTGDPNVVIDESIPVVDQAGRDDQVKVRAYETPAGTAAAWSLTARAVCATGLTGVRLVSVPGAIDTTPSKTVVAECPNGTKVVGTSYGARSAPGEVMVTAVDPIAGLNGDPDVVSVTAHPAQGGLTTGWGVTAFAFCATTPAGWEIESNTYNPTRDATSVSAACDAGEVGLGAGAYFTDVAGVANGNVMLWGLSVNGPFTQFPTQPYIATASGKEDADGTPVDWELTVKLICVTA